MVDVISLLWISTMKFIHSFQSSLRACPILWVLWFASPRPMLPLWKDAFLWQTLLVTTPTACPPSFLWIEDQFCSGSHVPCAWPQERNHNWCKPFLAVPFAFILIGLGEGMCLSFQWDIRESLPLKGESSVGWASFWPLLSSFLL